jgi:UDP-N-acetylglucosamine:LPS N-acetylglucosamine transferase
MRVLIATGDLGDGHNAAARAVDEALHGAYPDCLTHRVEMLRLMGRTVGRGTKWSYILGVGPFGVCYQAFFDAVWRHRLFAAAVNWFVGHRAGPALEREITAFGPDVVITTFPMASQGSAWLRSRGRLPVPVVAVVPDFAPHPFWVLPELDLHLVSHQVCLDDVAAVSPRAAARVTTAPVVRAFRLRETVEIGPAAPQRPLRLLATFGGLGLGRTSALVRAILESPAHVCLTVVCGRNERMRRRLAKLDRGDGRLDVRGWVDDMPALLADSDAVVNNAGGASVLEALVCGVPALFASPIPGHGRANAARMAQAGLAVVCRTPPQLAAEVHRLASDPQYRQRLGAAAADYARGRDLARDLKAAVDEVIRRRSTAAPTPSARRSKAKPEMPRLGR